MRKTFLVRGLAAVAILGAAVTASPAMASAGGGTEGLKLNLRIEEYIPEGRVTTNIRVDNRHWERSDVFSRAGGPTFEPSLSDGPLKARYAYELRAQLPKVVGDAPGESLTCGPDETAREFTLTTNGNEFVARACPGQLPKTKAFSKVVEVLTRIAINEP